MNYETAAKQVRAAKKPESYLVFRFNYGERYILPHKEGLALLQSMSAAEQIPSYFNKTDPPVIKQIGTSSISIDAMSQEEYEEIKIAALLGIPLDDLKEAKKPKPVEQS